MERKYEAMLVFDSDLDEAGLQTEIEKVSTLIRDSGGNVEKAESWGQRQLAYLINKKSSGHYHLFLFSGEKETVARIKHQLRIEEKVLRFLVVNKDKFAPDSAPKLPQDESNGKEQRRGADSGEGRESFRGSFEQRSST